MDDKEKKELVKKIMEQRKALWKGEARTGRKYEYFSQPLQEKMEETVKEVDPTAIMPIHDTPVEIIKEEKTNANYNKDSKSSRNKQTSALVVELKKTGELGLRVIFTVIIILISALLLGILIGYGITTLSF